MASKGRAVFNVPISFGPESFTTPVDAQVLNICTLSSENLFPKERVMFSGRKATYSAIMPSLLLASRIILSEPKTFNFSIARKCHEGFIEEDIIALEPDILISKIRNYIPDIDLNPDMSSRGGEYGMTSLRPNEERDQHFWWLYFTSISRFRTHRYHRSIYTIIQVALSAYVN